MKGIGQEYFLFIKDNEIFDWSHVIRKTILQIVISK